MHWFKKLTKLFANPESCNNKIRDSVRIVIWNEFSNSAKNDWIFSNSFSSVISLVNWKNDRFGQYLTDTRL